MNATIERLRIAAPIARLRFLKLLNRAGALLFAAVVAFNQAYPQAISQSGLPNWALIPAGVAWLWIVEYATSRPKNPA